MCVCECACVCVCARVRVRVRVCVCTYVRACVRPVYVQVCKQLLIIGYSQFAIG